MVIEIKNLVKRYDKIIALDYLNLMVKEGQIHGILGPAGSGKTTLTDCILGLKKYDKGSILLWGKKMERDSYELKRDIGVVLEEEAVFEELTLYENISYFCSLYLGDKQKVKEYTKETIEFLGLEDFIRLYPKKLSPGLLRRLNFACGIVHKPKLLILDEPIEDTDPHSKKKIMDSIMELKNRGTTILYFSQEIDEIEQLCTEITMLDKGKVIAQGTKEELKDMISLGEKITVEVYSLSENQLKDISQLPNVSGAEYNNQSLIMRAKKGRNNLMTLLDYLQEQKIPFGRIITEMPTLDDVYLEITGKELKD
ncbi:ABC-2 type transport system ATP-binding protein [Anaerocolumna jejuensis DSM 15929]|uniref:ABC-2 type transport system ATP-binding protein n=1 Tax=Anaerocolumna jejuensis DSM 15929 TaxID=1121322 RepID=A0A1M6MFQ6_9FIRM|nr:ABC transporter ATP-binding protein [Anaerocolumna jejuensis]SHJ82319.1 ABC-2 type transport system ATP-binding protein [Anaerocolumna jejuensis DSM 15929]